MDDFWSSFPWAIGLFIVATLISAALPRSDKPLDGCECSECQEKRARQMVIDLLVRDLGMDFFERGKNDPVISTVEAGFRISIRPGGSLGFSVVALEIPNAMPELPELLMQRRVSTVVSAQSAGFMGAEVLFSDDQQFTKKFSLKVVVRNRGASGSGSGESSEVSEVWAMFNPLVRHRLLENAEFHRWWVIGARGRLLEAHFSKQWDLREAPYRELFSEAAWMLISIALRREIPRAALMSWRRSHQWTARDLVAGLLSGAEYDEKVIAARRPDVLLHEDLIRSGLNGAQVFSDARLIQTARKLGYLFDEDDQCIHLEKNGISMRLSLRKVFLSAYASSVAPDAEKVHLVTVLTVLLPATRKRLQPFRFGWRSSMTTDSTAPSSGEREDGWDPFFARYSLTQVGEDVGEDFEGTTMEALFNPAVRSYFTRPDVIRSEWVVEGYPSILEIHQGRLVEFETRELRQFINEAAAVGMVLLSSGRILPDPRFEGSVVDDTVVEEEELNQSSTSHERVGLKATLSQSTLDVSSRGVSFSAFEEKLTQEYPVKMDLLRAGLSYAEQKKHLMELYEEFRRTGTMPEL